MRCVQVSGECKCMIGLGAVLRDRVKEEQDSRLGIKKPDNYAEAWMSKGMGSAITYTEHAQKI